MAFNATGSLNPHGAPVLRREIITNSETTVLLDAHKLVAGFATACDTGALVFGHVTAHSTLKGIGLNTTGAAGAAMGSYVGTYAAAADNETVGKVKVECDISKFTLYAAELDDTIGTTNTELSGFRIDLVDENTLDENTTSDTGSGQYNTWGIAPTDSAKALVNIHESSVFGL